MILLNQTHYDIVRSLLDEAFPQPAKRRWTAKNLRTELETDRFHGLFSDNKLIAMYALTKTGAFYYLYGLCVNKNFRGKGFGKKILHDAAKQTYARPLIVHLEITERRAIAWYLREGFEPYHYEKDVVWMVRY